MRIVGIQLHFFNVRSPVSVPEHLNVEKIKIERLQSQYNIVLMD